jgi:hypothetical protein
MLNAQSSVHYKAFAFISFLTLAHKKEAAMEFAEDAAEC